MSGKVFQPDSDIHITFEDQQKINEFARHYARYENLKDELKSKEGELENLRDALEELDQLELLDDTVKVPFLLGEVFIHQNIEGTQISLKDSMNKVEAQMKEIKGTQEEILEAMSTLKTNLYAKFGNHINLEPSED